MIKAGKKPVPASAEALEGSFKILDTILEGNKWVAGDQLTIADFSIITTISTSEVR